MKYTTTVADYLTWRGDIPFSVDPFNEVDNLVLCIISYINFRRFPELLTRNPREAVSLRDICQKLTQEDEQLGLSQLSYIPVAQQAAQTERFAGTRMFAFEDRSDQETQFAAVTFLLPDKSVFVAFRGTDTSLVGWKEDFNMSYLESVPAQVRAAEYTAEIMRLCRFHKVRIGGHSKGGNLSVYAAVKAPAAVQDRIVRVYNNDGPGFAKPLVGTPEHTRVADRILTVVPQSSVVGQLLEHEQNVEIVRSDAEGMLQHDGFSWQVVGDHFIHLDGFSREGKVIDETLESWEGSLSPKQREAFADALYTVLTASGAKTLSDLNGDKLKSAVTMLKTYSNLDRETRQLLSGSLRALVGSYAKNVADDVQKNDLEPLRRKLERQRKKAEKRGAKKK